MRSFLSKIPHPTVIVTSGLLLSLCWHKILTPIKRYPFNTFLFRPEDKFNDFFNFWIQCRSLNPYLSVDPTPTRPYFPFAYLFNRLFMFEGPWFSFYVYFGLCTLIIIILAFMILRKLGYLKVWPWYVVTLILSYPYIMVVDRGNPEISILLFLLVYIYHYIWSSRTIAVVSLAFVIAMKLTPLLFLVLYIKDKRYKEALYVALLALVLSIGSLWFLSIVNPSTTLHDHFTAMLKNQFLFTKHYGMGTEGMIFNHSLFSMIKYFTLPELGNLQIIPFSSIVKYYNIFIVFFVSIVIGTIIYKRPATKIVITLIVCLMLVSPHASGDYKLINIYLPLLFWVSNFTRLTQSAIISILLSLIIIPKSYYHNHILEEASSTVFITPTLLMISITILLFNQFIERSRPDDRAIGSI